jgi:co-chaperonin GroES (HSP10)
MRILGRWVAIVRDEKRESASGIQLLEAEIKHQGTVIGVGSSVDKSIEVGSHIAFTPFAYFEHTIDGEKVLFLDERDVQSIL